jgi:hypothetical protein
MAESLALARIARVPWWRRLLARFRRPPTVCCARCGHVRDNGQRLPKGTSTVCSGTVSTRRDARRDLPPDWTYCIRLGVRWD